MAWCLICTKQLSEPINLDQAIISSMTRFVDKNMRTRDLSLITKLAPPRSIAWVYG